LTKNGQNKPLSIWYLFICIGKIIYDDISYNYSIILSLSDNIFLLDSENAYKLIYDTIGDKMGSIWPNVYISNE